MNNLEGLGNIIPTGELNSEILESVTANFKNEVCAIEEANNVSEILTNVLMRNLMAAEMVVAGNKARKKANQIKPTITLKSTKSINESPMEDEDDKDDEIIVMTKQFNKYLKSKRNRGEFPPKFGNARNKGYGRRNSEGNPTYARNEGNERRNSQENPTYARNEGYEKRKSLGNPTSTLKCFECKQPGHVKEECPTKRRSKPF
ncbi:hypothetical protein LIER_24504 [Lithospermum erythrorhizon]|uniref:CCHC-type domain-containing protein n=1 Tax=Lithospermum erythrorhizon TaxID=34254 RepID=A0AAV3R5C9_LITER